MEEIKGIKLDNYPFTGEEWVEDFLWYDGPLFSHFNLDGEHLLHYWCDTDNTSFHRWLVIRTTKNNVDFYKNGHLNILGLISQDENSLYIVDFDNGHIPVNIWLVSPEFIPKSYLPAKGYKHQYERY